MKAVREFGALQDQIQQQSQEFNALYTVGKKVTGLLEVEEILAMVVGAAANLTHAEEGSLMLLDPDSGELYLRAHYNLAEHGTGNLRVKVTDTLMGRVIQTGRPIMVSGNDLLRVQTSFLVKAILSVPLLAGGRVTGVLSVDNKHSSHTFSEHEVHVLSTLADYAAIAIENARLYWSAENERSKLETILREIQDAVIVTDPELHILLINKAAQEAFGLKEDVVGRPLADVIQIPTLLDLFDQQKLRSRNWRAEIVLADGRTLQGQLSILTGIGYGAVMQDISRLKELDRIKSEFVAIVSHDLRTPLTTIRGYVSLLPRVGPLNDQQQEFVSRVERSMSNIVDLIADLLDIGRIEAGLDWEMEPLELHTLVIDAAEQLRPSAAAKHQALTVNVPPVAQTMGHARRLEQVATNLIGNAIKYTPENGRVDVTLREHGDFLVLQVHDTGIGISTEDQPHVFDKFYRVESEATEGIGGSGLGLSIVKAIVEKHLGRVWVDSILRQGSTFTVLLPKYLP
jgi:two-component system phosphate regulon sensor histidine kinase PhoR